MLLPPRVHGMQASGNPMLESTRGFTASFTSAAAASSPPLLPGGYSPYASQQGLSTAASSSNSPQRQPAGAYMDSYDTASPADSGQFRSGAGAAASPVSGPALVKPPQQPAPAPPSAAAAQSKPHQAPPGPSQLQAPSPVPVQPPKQANATALASNLTSGSSLGISDEITDEVS
jgi:hypothetical protein